MHELSVCLSLLESVRRIAHHHRATAVTRVVIRVGPLSGVEPELLRNAYPIAAAGTAAEHAELVIESMPVRVRCTVCGVESAVAPNRLLCRDCGDFRTRVVSGDELLLAQLELGDAQRAAGSPAPRDRSSVSSEAISGSRRLLQ